MSSSHNPDNHHIEELRDVHKRLRDGLNHDSGAGFADVLRRAGARPGRRGPAVAGNEDDTFASAGTSSGTVTRTKTMPVRTRTRSQLVALRIARVLTAVVATWAIVEGVDPLLVLSIILFVTASALFVNSR